MLTTFKRPLVRELDDRFLPRTFNELVSGDVFNTNAVEDWGLSGISVTCLRLASGQSEKGNAVVVWGDRAGQITCLESTAEVELHKSGSNEAMNAHLRQLRIEKEQKKT